MVLIKKGLNKLFLLGTIFMTIFILTNCVQINLVEEYKNKEKAKLESYISDKGIENYTIENWEIILTIVSEGKKEIDAAGSKAVAQSIVEQKKQEIDQVPTIMDDLLKLFDLTDPVDYWIMPIDFDFEQELVIIIKMKKTQVYPTLELEQLRLENAIKLHYYYSIPNLDRSNDGNYLENFRQMAVISLNKYGKEEVIKAIKELEKLEFIKTAYPKYVFEVLNDYKENRKIDIGFYADNKGIENYTNVNWEIIQQITLDSKTKIDLANDKKTIDNIIFQTKQEIDLVLTEMDEIAALFNLNDPKIFEEIDENCDFEIDRVAIVFRQTKVYPILELRHFKLENAKSITYYFAKPSDISVNNDGFRQLGTIMLKIHGKEEVRKAIKELGKLPFIRSAAPEYIYNFVDD